MNHKMSPIREVVEPKEIQHMVDESIYPRPRWMLNKSVHDDFWSLSENGIERSFYENNKVKSNGLNFKEMLIAPDEYLSKEANQSLLLDIKNSILYFNVKGEITRPKRVYSIVNSTINLIYHTNELRIADNKPLIHSLSEIKYNDLNSYLLAYGIDINNFEKALQLVTEQYNLSEDIDWDAIKENGRLTRRELLSIKNKIIKYLKSHDNSYIGISKKNLYKPQYKNASSIFYEPGYRLQPTESTISNTISLIETLFSSRTAQKYPFQHSPMNLFKSGRELFNLLKKREKTALMPVNIALHTMSSALRFLREYAEPLCTFINRIYQAEKSIIKELGIAYSTAFTIHRYKIKTLAFQRALMPDSLKDLNITSWGLLKNEMSTLSFDRNTNGISVGAAVRLYVAAIWIAICSFVAARTTSLRTLKRSCFVQSPIDNLFDIVLKIPKSSERYELEDVHRPIPDLLYDYGLQFSSLACLIEERRGLDLNEDELYLFSHSVSYRAISSGILDDGAGDFIKKPLGDDYIKTCLDMFQDWSNSPLINGKRWYCTTHQFRRFFAVLYFNFSDNFGLDELSWFMGHSNLDQTFYYAEISPSDEWVEEAENTIARIGADLSRIIRGDNAINEIVTQARKSSTVYTVLEGLVHDLIAKHKEQTSQVVRFYKIDNNEVFFYFTKGDGESDG